MQVTVTLFDGTEQTFTAADSTATVKVDWQTTSQDGFQTQSFTEAFAAAEVASVTFAPDPAPAPLADPAPAETPAVDAPAADPFATDLKAFIDAARNARLMRQMARDFI
jgi:hypothetical protein